MRKPDSLRAAIADAVPGLNVDPDRFLVFVKDGKLVSRWTASPAFEMRYRLIVGLIDFAGDPNIVFLTLIDWVRANQADILAPDRDDDALTFSADILDPQAADIEIQLQLTEAVTATPKAGGGWDIAYCDEPSDDLFGLNAAAAPLAEVMVGDTRILG